MDITIISSVLKFLVLLTDIIIILYILLLLLQKLFIKKSFVMKPIHIIKKHATLLAFLVALVSTLGSLYYSNILHYEPCLLCWFQRIFMYPLTIILGINVFTKEKSIAKYVLALSGLGLIFAIWHYITQRIATSSVCSIFSTVSCTTTYTFAYGYITISMMAITGFVAIILLMFSRLRK